MVFIQVNSLFLEDELIGYRFDVFKQKDKEYDRVLSFDVEYGLHTKVCELLNSKFLFSQGIPLYGKVVDGVYMTENEVRVMGIEKPEVAFEVVKFVNSIGDIKGVLRLKEEKKYNYLELRYRLSEDSQDALRFIYNYYKSFEVGQCDCSIVGIPVPTKHVESIKFVLDCTGSFEEFVNRFRGTINNKDFMGSFGKCYVYYNGLKYTVGYNVNL